MRIAINTIIHCEFVDIIFDVHTCDTLVKTPWLAFGDKVEKIETRTTMLY